LNAIQNTQRDAVNHPFLNPSEDNVISIQDGIEIILANKGHPLIAKKHQLFILKFASENPGRLLMSGTKNHVQVPKRPQNVYSYGLMSKLTGESMFDCSSIRFFFSDIAMNPVASGIGNGNNAMGFILFWDLVITKSGKVVAPLNMLLVACNSVAVSIQYHHLLAITSSFLGHCLNTNHGTQWVQLAEKSLSNYSFLTMPS
jgi:hypothetical protein